jgi:hypothetical protein
MWHDIWSLVLLIGLWGWIISTLVFIFRAFPSQGVFASRSAMKWGVCIIVSFMTWIIGLLKA